MNNIIGLTDKLTQDFTTYNSMYTKIMINKHFLAITLVIVYWL